jgi:hypothetical protein
MFGDWQWDGARTTEQEARLEAWWQNIDVMRLAVIECGAGTAVRTVRRFCEGLAITAGATLIRINVREPDVPDGHIGLAVGARAALEIIDTTMNQ